VGSRFRGRRWSGGGFGWRTVGRTAIANHAKYVAHEDIFALVPLHLEQDATLVGRHLEINLVGFELHERIAHLNTLTGLLQPACDSGLDHRFSELGHYDICRHDTTPNE
jgi:hypothetical protein